MKAKRPTKIEEGKLKVHLDIDGNKEEVLNDALRQVKQILQLIVGQDEIEDHDVTLEVSVLLNRRTLPQDTSGRDVGMGMRV